MSNHTIYDAHGIGEAALDGLRAAAMRIKDARRRQLRQPPHPIPPLPVIPAADLPDCRGYGLVWEDPDSERACVALEAIDNDGRPVRGSVARHFLRALSPSEVVELTEDAERIATEMEAQADARDAALEAAVAAALSDAEPAIRALAERLSAERQSEAEREAWVREHGSPRLQRLLTEGIEHDAVYRDERLALERPGWRWNRDVPGSADDPRNVPMSALELLDEARETDPDAELVYWTVHDEDDEDDDGEPVMVRGYTCVAEFLGRRIVYRVADDGTPPIVID